MHNASGATRAGQLATMKIFLSAVSSEFEACRDALASDLRAVGAEVVVQRDFQQQGRTLLEKLETYIAGCDRVIALVGSTYGWEPEVTALPPGAPRRSYTQWEYAFAQGERLAGPRQPAKDTFVYFASPEFPRFDLPAQDADRTALQQAFVASIAAHDKDRSTFASVYELRVLVLRDGFHLDGVTAQPELTLDLFNLAQSNRFFYGAQRAPIVGRDDELTALREFLHADARFTWWLMCGPAGVGKSRTALECCLRSLRDQLAWHAGWLANIDEFTEWRTWQPKAPTLLVIDDAARVADETRRIIVALFRRSETLAHPVRVLLLERDASEAWRERLTGSGADRHSLDASQYGDPLMLHGLQGQHLWEIVRAIVERERGGALPDRDQTVAALQKIDALNCPLFASFVADALVAGRDIGQWDRKELLESLLKTDMEQRWQPAGVTDEDKNLLAVATLADGLALTVLKNPPVAGWLPTPRSYSPDRYRVMCGRPSDSVLNPLTPAILGELFVLEHLRATSSIDERPSSLIDIALALPCTRSAHSMSYGWKRGEESERVARLRQHLYFVGRCAADFPDHPSLEHVFGPLPGPDDNSWGWAVDVANLIDELLTHPGTPDFCHRLHDALYEVVFERTPTRGQVPTYRVASSAMKLVLLSVHAKQTERAAHRYGVLRTVTEVEPELAHFQAAAGAGLAKGLARDHKLKEAHAVFSEAHRAWTSLPADDRSGPVYALVIGAAALVEESVKVGAIDLADARYQDLREVLEGQGDTSLVSYETDAIVALADARIKATALSQARALYDDLMRLTRRFSSSAAPSAPDDAAPTDDASRVESDPAPVITAENSESGSSVTFEWTPSPQSTMGEMLGRLLHAAIIEPLSGHKLEPSTGKATEPDHGPDLRRRTASLAVDLLRAYGEAEDIDHATEIHSELRALATEHPDEQALPYLHGHGTYILWRALLIQGQLSAAATACEELRVIALAHIDDDPAYVLGFAIAARGTINVWHDSGQPGVAELVRAWNDALLREDAREAIVAKLGLEDADRFYALLAGYSSESPVRSL